MEHDPQYDDPGARRTRLELTDRAVGQTFLSALVLFLNCLRDESKISSANWRNSVLVIEARKTSCHIPLPLGLSQRGDNWPATERPLHLFSGSSVWPSSWPVVIPPGRARWKSENTEVISEWSLRKSGHREDPNGGQARWKSKNTEVLLPSKCYDFRNCRVLRIS